jgi:DNA-directed RNA polymerase delta subunit
MVDQDTKNLENPASSNILDKIMGSQTQSSLNEFQPAALVSSLLLLLKDRDREILSKRFGLDGMEMETLEGIGKRFTLTRERVRQIEKDSLNFLKKQKQAELESALQLIFDTIKEHGSIIGEEYLMQTMQIGKSEVKERRSIKFLLNLGTQFRNLRETTDYYEAWYIVGLDLMKLQQVISEFMTILEASGKVLEQEKLYSTFKQTSFHKEREQELNDKVLRCYLNLAKIIQINPYNEIGLKNWNEVKPRDVGDKAYLVLKHHGKPEHYSEITKMINEHKFDSRVAFQETVHNELIKDNRFVLIGRGIYALSEWGYKKGVVADVIKEILKSFNRPLSRDEIINEVLKKRQVKRNTILVGLSNRKNFQKVGKDKYALATTDGNI